MNKFVRAAIIAIVMAQAACPVPARAGECRPAGLASFDIAYAAVVVPVTINGAGYGFLVDTGGYVSTLSPGVVAELGLVSAPLERGHEMYMTDGTVLDTFVTVDDLELGAEKSRGVRFVVQPQTSRAGIEHFAGTLGPDFLHNFDLDFDFGNRKLNLFPPGQCGGAYWSPDAVAVPFRTDGANHIIVPAKLDGVQTTAVIDTGASHTVMSQELANRAFHLAPGAGLTKLEGAGDRSLVQYAHSFNVLALNGVEFDDLTVFIMPDEMAKSVLSRHEFKMADRIPKGPAMNAYPVIIGMDQLRKTHFYVDYKNQMLYFTAAGASYTESPVQLPVMPDAPPATPP